MFLQAVPDVTGGEDLLEHLRMALLIRTAAKLGCSVLALGDSATRLAIRTISLTSKGCGFALPASIQYLDARY